MHALSSSVPAHVIVLISIIILGSCLGNASQTALNAMFTAMATDFGVDVGMGQWVTTLYMLVLGITVPAVTYLTRRFSARQVVLGALALLLVGSVIDAVAWDFASLIAGRVLQAVSAGITLPLMITVVMTSFLPNRQATVMGIAGIAMGFAPNIGPTIGGWVVTVSTWRAFFIALAVCSLVLFVLGMVLIRRSGVPQPSARLDGVSLALSALGFGGLLLGFSNASSFGMASALVWVPAAVGAVVLMLFLRRQRRIDDPLINLTIFDSPVYRASFWAANCLFACYLGITLILPLFVENCWGGTPFEAGLSLLPGTVAAFVVNPIAGLATDRVGIRPVALVGGACLAVGAISMAFIDENTPFWLIIVLQGIRAFGVSGLIGPLTSWGLSELPHEIMTDGSSFSTAARQAAGSIGTALMVFAITLGPALGGTAAGYHLAFAISGVFGMTLLGIVLARAR